MAYEKQTWQTGDVITATKLNHMEDGIGNSQPLIVGTDFVDNKYQLKKTFGEIFEAFKHGITVVVAILTEYSETESHEDYKIISDASIEKGETYDGILQDSGNHYYYVYNASTLEELYNAYPSEDDQ